MTPVVRSLIALVAVALIPVSARMAGAQARSLPETFTAIGHDPTADAATTTSVEIRITRWSTARDETALSRTLVADGPEALLEAVRDAPAVGSIESPGNLRWSLRFAWQQRTPDGRRRILILADRPISGWEVMLGAPTLDYPFSVIELWIAPSGEGDGVLSVATRIIVDPRDGRIAVEGYDALPTALTQVASRRPT